MVISNKHLRYYVHGVRPRVYQATLIRIMAVKNEAKDFASEDWP
jgi:hypothetical protein